MNIKINHVNQLITKNEVSLTPKKEKTVLLHAVTPTELKCLRELLKKRNYAVAPYKTDDFICEQVYGLKGNVYITQSQAGSIGPASIMNTMHSVKTALEPDYAVMGGIAFGLAPKKEALGDIVVSRQVWSYESAKLLENGILSRGDKITASSRLLEGFTFSAVQWEKSKIHFGTYASGEKLVNSGDFRTQLLQMEPELLAGDMEASGFSSVCYNQGINWIVAKGISDWGVNKTDFSQEEAAGNSWEFILNTVETYIL